MLEGAVQEYREIDIAKEKQVDPFARDKVMKLESASANTTTLESIKYGENLMEAIKLAEEFRDELE